MTISEVHDLHGAQPGASVPTPTPTASRRAPLPPPGSHLSVKVEPTSRLLVDVEVRGDIEQLWWTADGIGGDAAAVERLRHLMELDPVDPVEFLVAVRSAFGDRIVARFTEVS